MSATKRDYYELLGVARAARRGEIKQAFRRLARELHPDVSEAPDAEERFREVVEAYEVLSKSETRELYDRFGHAGLRSGGFSAAQFDFGSLSDLFSAFFGDDLFGAGGRPRRGAGRGRRGGGRDRARRGCDRRDAGRPVTRSPSRASTATATVPSRAPARAPARRAAARAGCSRSRGACFGEFVRSQAVPAVRRRGRLIEQPCADVRRVRAARSRSRRSPVEIPAGIHDGQRIRRLGRGPRGQPRRPRRRRLRPRSREARSEVRARGRRRLLDGRPDDRRGRTRRDADDRDARRRARARLRRRGRRPAEIRVLRAAGCRCCRGSAAAPTGCS